MTNDLARSSRTRRPTLDSLGDAELVELLRGGDPSASAELWRRHAAAGRTVARTWSRSLDPDDLLSEAFLRVLSAIERGGGPEGAFRPFLFTAIRNVAITWSRRRQRERPFDDEEDVVALGPGPEERALAALDRDLGVRAFRALPPRWQEVLWYTTVEGLSPVEAAPLLGLRPNGVAALSRRAREGLRGAWIQEHVIDSAADGECRWVLERAGAHSRGRLPARDRLRLRSHLTECDACRAALADAEQSSARLATVLLPLVAGVGGAAAYAATGTGAAAGGAAVVALHSGASVGGASAATVSMVSVGVGIVLVAGVAAAALLAPPPGPATPDPPETVQVTTDESAVAPPSTPTPSTEPPAPPAAPTPAAPEAVAETVAAPAPAPAPPEIVPTASPTAAPTPVPSATASPRPTPTAAPTPRETPPPPPTPTPDPPRPPTAVLTTDPDGHLLPDASGTAEPGSVVTIEDAATGIAYATTTAAADGAWSVTALDLPAGETSVVVRTVTPDGTVSIGESSIVSLRSPSVLVPSSARAGVPVTGVVLAESGIVELMVDDRVVEQRTVSALGFEFETTLDAGAHEIGVRYASADGRFGPTSSSAILVQ